MFKWIKTSFMGIIVAVSLIISWNVFFSSNFFKFDNLKSISNIFHKELSVSNDSQIPLFVKTIKKITQCSMKDIIVLKELPLNYNYAGVEDMESFLVANGILHFTHHHKLLKMIVEDISQNYDGSIWAKNGPVMVTSNLIKLCKAKTMKAINDAKCHNIQLLPPNAFFSQFIIPPGNCILIPAQGTL
ncbi:unnamed protein product [Lepeophtheirus salmonis]|uniref:(salmon louse) hypothetical protein n=1 Tax=Lepeophtheirus salmonis TaxID=72036 RepID=A0A7R8H877_LEPSM|nr:unnamed protein product [Lepeophtheirus salmonis]CAF2932394.1 unnamed protein product [Lepeophtheirus salmonis]